jgi:hypothetical protein
MDVERISVGTAATHLQRSEHVSRAAGEPPRPRPSGAPLPEGGAPPRPSAPPRPRPPIITKKFSKIQFRRRNAAKRLYC